MRLYGGSDCTGNQIASVSAAELASPGIVVAVGEGPINASFSATASDAAGNTSDCSAPISYTSSNPPEPGEACIVPKLAGKRLGRAKALLRAAHCSVGKVQKPRHKMGRRLGALVVKSSNPPSGTDLPNGSAVNLRLAHKHRKAHRS